MHEQDESEVEHTLLIVERDDLDDAVPYQVMKAEHPPDSEQAKALEGVMCQLVEAAEAETGEPHRLVTEADTPEITQRHYEMHEERIEGDTLVTDGGVDQSEAGVNRSHQIVDEAYELMEEKIGQEEVTSEDVVEVGELLKEAMDHPEQDICTTLNAEGPKNQCLHHKYPEGPYAYEPHESPRECLLGILNHEIEVTVS